MFKQVRVDVVTGEVVYEDVELDDPPPVSQRTTVSSLVDPVEKLKQFLSNNPDVAALLNQ